MPSKNTPQFIILTEIFGQEDDVWTAKCKELGTATFGETFEEAQRNLREAISLHLNTLDDVGECDKFLRANSIRVYSRPPRKSATTIPVDTNIFINRNVTPLPLRVYC